MNRMVLLLIALVLKGLTAQAAVNTKADGNILDSWTTLPEKTFSLGNEGYRVNFYRWPSPRWYVAPGVRTGHLVATVRKRTDNDGSRYGIEVVGYYTFKTDDDFQKERDDPGPPSPDLAAGLLSVRLLVAEADFEKTQSELNKIQLLITGKEMGAVYESESGKNHFVLSRNSDGIYFSAEYKGSVRFVGPDLSWNDDLKFRSMGTTTILAELASYFDNAIASFNAAKRELDGFRNAVPDKHAGTDEEDEVEAPGITSRVPAVAAPCTPTLHKTLQNSTYSLCSLGSPSSENCGEMPLVISQWGRHLCISIRMWWWRRG